MATYFRFDKAFDYEVRVGPRDTLQSVVAYRVGVTDKPIPDAHAEAAEKAGVGARVADPKPAEGKGGKRG